MRLASKDQRPDPARFVAVDELGRRVQGAVAELETAGQLTRGDYIGPPPRFNGYCARMCQAYKFLALDSRTSSLGTPGAKAMYAWKRSLLRGDDTHYWIQTSHGIMDLNFGPDDVPHAEFWPYSNEPRAANSWGFHRWKPDPRYPANLAARRIMDAVWADVG